MTGLKMTMKNRIMLIITAAIIIIAVFCVILWMSGLLISTKNTTIKTPTANGTPELADMDPRLTQCSPEVQNEIQTLSKKYSIPSNKWRFDPLNNEINLYAHDIRNESTVEELRAKHIGNCTLFIIHDTEFETTREEVRAYLTTLWKNPDYQIASTDMTTDTLNNPPENYVELWVYRTTPENKKLDNAVIKGWKILVYPVAPLPAETTNSYEGNIPK